MPFCPLLAQEREDISWQALTHQVPQAVLAGAVRVGANTLATPDNMARWGKREDTKCRINNCGATSNLGHLLKGCKQSLDRFQFWHNSVLTHIVQKVVFAKPDTI